MNTEKQKLFWYFEELLFLINVKLSELRVRNIRLIYEKKVAMKMIKMTVFFFGNNRM